MLKGVRVRVPCPVPNKEKYIVQEYIIEGNGRKRPATRVTCNYCDKEFLKATRFLGNKNYCNKECSYAARRKSILVKCAHCGKDVEKKPSDLKKSRSGLYFCCG